jgi:Tol biopolymer transport system component
LWIINIDGGENRPLTSGDGNDRSPRWSPDSTRLSYLSGDNELMCRWIDTGNVGRLVKLPAEPPMQREYRLFASRQRTALEAANRPNGPRFSHVHDLHAG